MKIRFQNKCGKVLVSILLLALVTGCWDNRELTDIAFVVALGIDQGTKERVKVSVQVVNPGMTSSSQTSPGSSPSSQVSVYSAEGKNVFEANRKISQRISRNLHYGHALVLMIGEEIARKQGIFRLLDGSERDNEFRPSAVMALAKGTTAEEILKTPTLLDKLPAVKIKKLLKTTESSWGENVDVRVNEVIRGLVASGKQPIISGFNISHEKKADVS